MREVKKKGRDVPEAGTIWSGIVSFGRSSGGVLCLAISLRTIRLDNVSAITRKINNSNIERRTRGKEESSVP